MIKNQYLLSLTNKSLDQLSQAKKYIWLNLTNAYYQKKNKEENK